MAIGKSSSQKPAKQVQMMSFYESLIHSKPMEVTVLLLEVIYAKCMW